MTGPLPRPPQLWRDHGKISGSDGGIHVVVCCCNEDDEELKVGSSLYNHIESLLLFFNVHPAPDNVLF